MLATPMPKRFSSDTEANAAPYFAALGCVPCQTFAPHFQTEFTDKRGTEFTGKPDFYHAASNTFFEAKFCELGTPQSFSASDNKMRAQYRFRFGNDAGLKYREVSAALWHSKWRNDCLQYGWNHCLHKHLLIQKALGSEKYIVIFGNELKQEIADSYTKRGLHFMHISKLEAYLKF